MNIVFVVERPTQFEAPFYRFAARNPGDAGHELRVLFTGTDVAEPVFDPELGRPVSWGIDLLGGYPHEVCPQDGAEAGSRSGCGRSGAISSSSTATPSRSTCWGRVWRTQAGVPTALRLDSVL